MTLDAVRRSDMHEADRAHIISLANAWNVA